MGFLGVIFRQTIILFFVSDKSSTPAESHFSRILLVVILKNHYFCRAGDKQYSLKERTVGSMNKLFYCFLLTTLLCGCKERKEPQTPVRQPVTTEYVEKGNQRVRSLNQRNAGFVSTAMQTVEVSDQCFGVKEPSLLDRLPRVDEASRKDSALISQLNEGDVFLLQPGEKGVVQMEDATKMLVRFQVAELWIWKSNVIQRQR